MFLFLLEKAVWFDLIGDHESLFISGEDRDFDTVISKLTFYPLFVVYLLIDLKKPTQINIYIDYIV